MALMAFDTPSLGAGSFVYLDFYMYESGLAASPPRVAEDSFKHGKIPARKVAMN